MIMTIMTIINNCDSYYHLFSSIIIIYFYCYYYHCYYHPISQALLFTIIIIIYDCDSFDDYSIDIITLMIILMIIDNYLMIIMAA